MIYKLKTDIVRAENMNCDAENDLGKLRYCMDICNCHMGIGIILRNYVVCRMRTWVNFIIIMND